MTRLAGRVSAALAFSLLLSTALPDMVQAQPTPPSPPGGEGPGAPEGLPKPGGAPPRPGGAPSVPSPGGAPSVAAPLAPNAPSAPPNFGGVPSAANPAAGGPPGAPSAQAGGYRPPAGGPSAPSAGVSVAPRHVFRGEASRFGPRELQAWRGGRWYHGSRRGRYGWWWIVDGIWYFYPYPIYPYPGYVAEYYYEEYPARYWYWCDYPAGYYPYIQNCYYPWRAVPPQPPAY